MKHFHYPNCSDCLHSPLGLCDKHEREMYEHINNKSSKRKKEIMEQKQLIELESEEEQWDLT